MGGSQEPLELSHGEEGAVVPVLGYLTLLWFLIPFPSSNSSSGLPVDLWVGWVK